MNKTFLIIKREYLSRVQKKSFILLTILMPLIFAGIYALGIYLAIKPGEERVIGVIDKSELFKDKFTNSESLKFQFSEKNEEELKQEVSDEKISGALIIPVLNLEDPDGIILYSKDAMGISVERTIVRTIKNEIEDIKLKASGIDKNVLDSIDTNVSIHTLNLSSGEEKESNSTLATIVGVFSGFLIYLFLFVYGTQVMRGVIEEKNSKIVEIIISSVKPIQLMLGKILGIAAVGLSQFLIWVFLTVILWTFVTPLVVGDDFNKIQTENVSEEIQQAPSNDRAEVVANISKAIAQTDVVKILGLLIFYFLTGYLFYAALFAMIGSAVDNEADSQQFIFPVIMPIIFSFIMYGAVINDPNGATAFWLSIIPFTAPIIMMIRVPFEIPNWEIILSMVLMIVGFFFTTWMAGRVYRIGILMHGTKVNYKTLGKWLMMKN